MALGWVYLYRRDYEPMKHHVDLAIKLNPNDADMLANASYMLAAFGAAEDAIQCGRSAMRLNPRHPDWYPSFLSMALFTARRYAEAWELRSRVPNTFYDSLFLGAAMLAYLNRLEEAQTWGRRAVDRLKLRLGESTLQTNNCIQLLLENNPYQRQEDSEHFAQGMRMAGIPG